MSSLSTNPALHRILIVEDEAPIAMGLRFNFEQEGYQAIIAPNGTTALETLQNSEFHLVVLDLMLPGLSGYEICKRIREFNTTIPIMVLSARLNSDDKAHAFDCGADQYVTKPFDLNEVLSRVRNLIQSRSKPSEPDTAPREQELFEFGDVQVNCATYEVTTNEQTNSLTKMEMDLLKYFLTNPGVVLARSKILTDVWGYNSDVTTRSIDNFVMRLRRFIEPESSKPRHILSVRGTGYRFIPDPETTTA